MIHIDNNDLLKYAIENGIINLEDVRNNMVKKENERLLNTHKYKIFQDKDGRWKTTLPDPNKSSGRRLIARKEYETLINEIVDFYRSQEKEKLITLNSIYPEWLIYKNKHTTSGSYIRRIQNDWNKYYKDSDIINIPIKNLNYLKLDTWAHELIKKNNLTKKQYYNLAIIMRQCLEYVVNKEDGTLETNPFQRVNIDSKMFYKKAKPKSETQVFNEKDELEICKLALEKYKARPKSISGLAIILNFNLGLRIGELVALKWSDIDEDSYINVHRTEVTDFDVDEDGNVIRKGTKVVEHTKSFAGDRKIYINKEAKEILSMIKKRNLKYGLYDDDYIFVNSSSSRLKSGKVNNYLYELCDNINSIRKSSHKIRKTYISSLFDNGININKIREIAGHEDERTSLNNYCFDRKTDRDTENILENISSRTLTNVM